MHYYQHHIGDFRSGTALFERLERWLYRDMLDWYYDREQPLPIDLADVCEEIGAKGEDQIAAVAKILRLKFVRDEAGWIHERCERELANYRMKAATAKENGKKSAATRYQKGEYMPGEGALYAVRVSSAVVKIGVTANLKSRMHQLRSKYGKHITSVYHVQVGKMGDAEADLLVAYDATRSGEEVPVTADEENTLRSHMDRIAVAYPVASSSHMVAPRVAEQVASKSHGRSPTNQEPITNNQKPDKDNYTPPASNDIAAQLVAIAAGKTKPATAGASAGAEPWFSGIDAQVVKDFKALRKAKKAAITATAMAMLQREAQECSMTMEQAMRVCCERGWTTVKREWLERRNGAAPGGGNQRPSMHSGFDKRDYTAGVAEDGTF